jgi:glutaredoxin
MRTLLSRWTRPRRAARSRPLDVTVYTRANCCCCHKALELLERYRRRHNLVIRTVDVDADLALAEQYGEVVPVVAVAGKVRFKGVVNPVLLERLLVAERRVP